MKGKWLFAIVGLIRVMHLGPAIDNFLMCWAVAFKEIVYFLICCSWPYAAKVVIVNFVFQVAICIIRNFNIVVLHSDILYVKFVWARFLKYIIIRYIYFRAQNSIGPRNLGCNICSSILFFLNLYFPFFMATSQMEDGGWVFKGLSFGCGSVGLNGQLERAWWIRFSVLGIDWCRWW